LYYSTEEILVDSCFFHFKNEIKECEHIKYKYVFKLTDIKSYLLIFFFFIKNLFNIEKLISCEINGINIGKPSFAVAMKNYSVYNNKYLLRYEIFKRLLYSVSIYIMAYDLVKSKGRNDTFAVYLKEIAYYDSIIFDMCMKYLIRVYINVYPRGVMVYNETSLTSVNIRTYAFPKISISDDKYENYMIGRIEKPKEYIYYYNPKNNNHTYKFLKSCKKNTVLLYAHSFTDAQLEYGYDGFINTYDWLCFTVDKAVLNDLKVIVKGHPNFWAKNQKSKVVEWDKTVWKMVKEKYRQSKNVDFIDQPLDNKIILESMNVKDTIVVSHHGNALVEAAYFGYRTISSICSPWKNDYYNFSNTWENKEQYEKLLKNIDNLKQTNMLALRNFVADNFFYNNMIKTPWWEIISKNIGVKAIELVSDPDIANKKSLSEYNRVVHEISRSIGKFD